MKKISAFITLAFFLTIGIQAQQPYYPTKEGVSLTYADKNGKGKIEGYSQMTVTKVEVTDEQNLSITTATQVMDDKKKELFKEPMVTTVHVRDGVVEFDPSSMAGKMMAGMKITGDSFTLPADASVGTVLDDYSVSVSMGAIKTTTNFTDVKVTGKETLNIGGRNLECLIVECTASSKVMGMKQETTEKTWYTPGIGQVKMEMYTKKGKLQSAQELIAVTGL